MPNCSRAVSSVPLSNFDQYVLRLSFRLMGSPIYASLTVCFTGTTFIAGFDEVSRGLTMDSSGGLNALLTSIDLDLKRLLTVGSSEGLNIPCTSVDFDLCRLLTGGSSGGFAPADFDLCCILTGTSSGGLYALLIGGLNTPSTSFDFDLFRLLTGGGLSFANSLLFSSSFVLPSIFIILFPQLLI